METEQGMSVRYSAEYRGDIQPSWSVVESCADDEEMIALCFTEGDARAIVEALNNAVGRVWRVLTNE